MRSSIAALFPKAVSTFFALTLALGLVPSAALAAPETESADTVAAAESSDVAAASESADVADVTVESEDLTEDVILSGEAESLEFEQSPQVPAVEMLNQEVELETVVAQTEGTRTFFLAQTLESTRTVPIVSAKLPLDASSGSAGGASASPTGQPASDAESGSFEDEGSPEEGDDGSDDPDLAGDFQDENEGAMASVARDETAGLSPDSVVVGSFTQDGMTFAMEPGGETVALVAADYSKFPQDFIDAKAIVLPEAAMTSEGDAFSVTRIADDAFINALPEEGDGIIALYIPASVSQVGTDALTGFSTLQYLIVSDDNPNYSSFDGCLYDQAQLCLLSIPEGRLGAVRVAPSATDIDPEVFSHCPSVETIIADPDSAASQLLEENGVQYKNANDDQLEIITTATDQRTDWENNEESINAHVQGLIDPASETNEENAGEAPVQSGARIALAAVSPASAANGTYTCWNMGTTPIWVCSNSSSFNCSGSHTYYYPGECFSFNGYNRWHMNYKSTCNPGAMVAWDTQNPCVCIHNFTSLYNNQSLQWTNVYTWWQESSGNYFKGLNGAFASSNVFYKTQEDRGDASISYGGEETKLVTSADDASAVKPVVANDDETNHWVHLGWSVQRRCFSRVNGTEITSEASEKVEISKKAVERNGGVVDLTSTGLDLYKEEPEEYYYQYRFEALFEKGYVVTLNNQEGEGQTFFHALTADDVYYVPCPDTLPVPTREDYIFNGYFEKVPVYNEVGEVTGYTKNYWYQGNDADGNVAKKTENICPEDNGELSDAVDLYADWKRDILLDTQKGDTTLDRLHVSWAESLPNVALDDEALCGTSLNPEKHTTKALPLPPTKTGFVFNGYWSTSFDESDPETDQYYDVVDDKLHAIEGKTWDIDQDRLYAHWRYQIKLDTNVFNSDNQSALDVSAITYNMTDGYTLREEGVWADELGNLFAVSLEGDDQVVSITAVEGASVRLPEVKNRTGYRSTQAWGTERLDNGAATNLFSSEKGNLVGGYTAKDGERVTPADANSAFVCEEIDGVLTEVLYVDWTGKAIGYKVNLVSQHSGFTNSIRTIELTVTYDQPITLSESEKALFVDKLAMSGSEELSFCGFFPPDASGVPYGKYSPHFENHPLYDEAVLHSLMYVNSEGAGTRAFREIPSDGSGGKNTIILYALWGYPLVAITFDLQDSSLGGILTGDNPSGLEPVVDDDGRVVGGKYFGNVVTHDLMPDVTALIDQFKVARGEGFEFTGFWNTKWAEEKADPNDTDGVEPFKYYDVDGTCAYDVDEDGIPTWDKTHPITLYAHWRYTVVLDMNVYNSDGQAVMDGNDFAADFSWKTIVAEQGEVNETTIARTAVVQDEGTAEQALAPAAQMFTAIDGAPLQLPHLTGRPGYNDTWEWVAANGPTTASPYLLDESTGKMKTSTFRPTTPLVTETLADGEKLAFTMKACWTSPKSYTVRFVTDYSVGSGDDAVVFRVKGGSAAVTNGTLREQQFSVTYDAPIDTTKLRAYLGDDGAAAYVDDVLDASGDARNLRITGFWAEQPVGIDQAGEGNRAYVQVAGDPEAFTSDGLVFRMVSADDSPTTPITLYALWGYSVTRVAFDLQGGTLNSQTAEQLGTERLTMTNVKSHDPVPSLAGALVSVPARPGYTFAGWWNTPWNEGSPREEVAGSGITVTPRCYYVAYDSNGDGRADAMKVNDGADAPESWLEFGNSTLYAHWRYTITFNTNVPATDLASVSRDLPRDGSTTRVAGVVALADGDGNGTDEYGNEYQVTRRSVTGYSNSDHDELVITATAGAPVQLPSAQNRRARVATQNTYARVGYAATWAWAQQDGTGALDAESATGHFTAEADAWTGAPRAAGSLPCKIGGETTSTTLPLYAQWTGKEMEFAVALNYSYSATFGSGEAARQVTYQVADHADELRLLVTYDKNNYRVLPGGSAAYSADGSLRVADVEGASGAMAATATTAGSTVPDRNLEFAGVTTRPADFAESPANAAFPASGVKYWDDAGALRVQAFRAVLGDDDVNGYNLDVYNTTNRPFPLYVAWRQPTSQVTFNLFDAALDADPGPTVLTELANGNGPAAFTLQKGAGVGASNGSGAASVQLQQLASQVLAYQASSNYVFGGFWSAPDEARPYQESGPASADPAATPTCYYVLGGTDGRQLVPATATADGWLTSDNASATWLEDHPVTLYAHWKYNLQFKVSDDDRVPQAGGTLGSYDMLLFGVADEQFTGATSEAIALATVDSRYTDARGRVTFGSPLFLPLASSTASDDAVARTAVSRIRGLDSDTSTYGFTQAGRTGYTFSGWTTSSRGTVAEADLCRAGSTFDTTSFTPQAPGVVTLYPRWQAETFRIMLEYYPATQWGGQIDESFIEAAPTPEVIEVPYDGNLREVQATIQPPALYGFDYLGFYAKDYNSDVQVSGKEVTGAGVKFFGAVAPDIGDETVDGMSQAMDVPWYKPITSAARDERIFAYYSQHPQVMTFQLRDANDGSLQEVTGRTPRQQTWHYGDKLWANSAEGTAATVNWADAIPATASLGKFSRQGYDFDGWYFLMNEPAVNDTSDEARELRADPSNRVYLMRMDYTDAVNPVPIWGVWTIDGSEADRLAGENRWVEHPSITTWRTATQAADGVAFSAEASYTLYASWMPKLYTVTFHTNYQNELSASNSAPVRQWRYEQVLAPGAANGVPNVNNQNAGRPFKLLGFNESTNSSASSYSETWLLDMTGYSASKPMEDYARMTFEDGGRFMPQHEGTTVLDYWAIWEDPGEKNIVLFAGAHGQLERGLFSDVTSYKVITHNYRLGWHIDEAGLRKREHPIELDVDDGYELVGWVELSPEDILGEGADPTSYDGVDLPDEEAVRQRAEQMAKTVNTADYAAGLPNMIQQFPENAKVTSGGEGYKNVYSGETGLEFRDIYLVAVYEIIGDYEIVLDLGELSEVVDSQYPDLGAFIDTGSSVFRAATSATNKIYNKKFSITTKDFSIPDGESWMHDFQGWELGGKLISEMSDAERPAWLGADGTVNVAAYCRAVENQPHVTTLTARFTPKRFTVEFKSDKPVAEGETESLQLNNVSMTDLFTLPYPAPRAGGCYFVSWMLETTWSGDYRYLGSFSAGTQIDLRRLINAAKSSTPQPYPDDFGQVDSELMRGLKIENNTITFHADWSEAISVQVPVKPVTLKIDPVNGVVLSAAQTISTLHNPDGENVPEVRVVSLRYDPLGLDGSDASTAEVFGSSALAGKAFLSVYADLNVGGEAADTSQLFRTENVDHATGKLLSGIPDVEGQKEPLLIDLSRAAVYSDNFPTVTSSVAGGTTTGTFAGLYNNAHLHEYDDPDHGLRDHGFRGFNKNNPLSVRFSLLFRDANGRPLSGDYLLANAPALAALGSDADDSEALPVARLYYTVGHATTATSSTTAASA